MRDGVSSERGAGDGRGGGRSLAAVDCGTNSIRLLIADVDVTSGQVQREVIRQNTIVRLGEGVDATGRLTQAAMNRTRSALRGYVDLMLEHGVSDVRMVATSATRDATNRDEFFDMTAKELGRVVPGAVAEVIDGTEEAWLSYRGATMDVDVAGPVVVIDVGGGSTEFVMGHSDGGVIAAVSTQMGSVRLTERFLHSDPPTVVEQDAARAVIEGKLRDVTEALPLASAAAVVGCAGTFTTVSAIVQDLPEYDPGKIHLSTLRIADILAVSSAVRGETVAERTRRPQVVPGRADVIGGGTLIVDTIAQFIRREIGVETITVSEKDILDGILAELAVR
ncbi:exopolyphosphatase [Corynebacterium kroppenstedtii]|uniref:Ppx/GppA phosphatase family protein n=1 Tax=Corynebacterium sp. PCR 32 TaxID=3351342 RepID=UPI0030ACD6BA